METPRISVILPTFNRAACLPVAIHSVLAQRRTDFELLVVDDGSTDATPEVLRIHAQDPRVRVLRKPNGGISTAMNLGLRHARGEFIARIDSDDRWHPGLLGAEVAVLEAEPFAQIVYARARIISPEGHDTGRVWGHAPRPGHSQLASMLYSDFTCNITVIARRECLERLGGYDESLTTSEDFDLWLRAAVGYRFAFVDRVLADVNIRADSISFDHDRYAQNRRDRERVLDKLFARPFLAPEVLAMKSVAYANLHTETALRYWALGRRSEALATLRKGLSVGDQPARVVARFAYFAIGNSGYGDSAVWRLMPRVLAALRRGGA